jgi:ribosome recycling factor
MTAQEARENADKFSLSADEMLNEIANIISANSKVGKTEIIVGFLSKVVDQNELNSVENSLREKGYTVNSSNDEVKIRIKISF